MGRSRLATLLTVCVVSGALVAEPSPALARTISEAPSPRCCMAMTYDAATDQVLLFGGMWFSGNELGETWTWDGVRWTKQSPAHRPAPRRGASLVYDASTRRAVLFGGFQLGGRYFHETWTWDGSDSTKEPTVHEPNGREYASMAYDAAHGQVVLFGGAKDEPFGQEPYRDTWIYDGTDWKHRSPAHSPSPRLESQMAYDVATGQVVLFGGMDGHGNILGDTWTWDGKDWRRRSPAHSPVARRGAAMVYDAARGKVTLFGGQMLGGNFSAETWTWDGREWTQLFPAHEPIPRLFLGAAFDDARAEMIVYGGVAAGFIEKGCGGTWAWDGSDWRQRPAAGFSLVGRKMGAPGDLFAGDVWGYLTGERVKLLFVDSVHGNTLLATYTVGTEGSYRVGNYVPANATPGRQHVVVKGLTTKLVTKVTFTVT